MKQKMSKKKKAAAITAGVLAVVIALGGTYAWTDYSQSALNIFKNSAEADVTLHDDFDGENKDVYVENTGSTDVFVRVKFAEYLQIGNDSILNAFGMTDGTKANPEDKTTWPVHQFKNADPHNVCDLADTHNYFQWNMTGNGKEFLAGVTESDGNGYAGLSKAQFDSYQVGDRITLGDGVTTYKRETAPASTILMLSQWLDLLNQGDYDTLSAEDKAVWDAIEAGCWLLDTDGWAYWSAALAPGQATNLLLDSVEQNGKKPYDNWVYNIDVQLQAATINEMDRWALDGRADVADPDNKIATVTETGARFIDWRSVGDRLVWEEIGTTNVFQEVIVSSTGRKTPTGNMVVAGNDGDITKTDDNNMLAGRSALNNGGIEITDINVSEMSYRIKNVSADFYVTSGIDKKLGTYDDVIKSESTALGQYTITSSTTENVGWNYLGGPISNMLVATEYVLDNTTYGSSYAYQGSNVFVLMQTLWDALKMDTTIVNEVTDLDMNHTDFNGEIFTCLSGHNTHTGCTCNFGTYSTPVAVQDNIDLTQYNTKFFALSLEEVYNAYGEPDGGQTVTSPYNDVQRCRTARYRSFTSGPAEQYNAIWADGVARSRYWLRNPGFESSRAVILDDSGAFAADTQLTCLDIGTRPACYLNLSAS